MSSSSQQIETATESMIKLPKPSSLLLKRLAPKHGHKKNLTILTPSYNEDSPTNGIQSAPLRRTTTQIPVFHNTNAKNKVVKKSSPPVAQLKKRFNNIPATASAISAPWPQTSAQARFPSPPIVPSQQPAWASQYRSKQPLKTANTPYFPPHTAQAQHPHTPRKAHSTSPQPHNLTQKQKFLQPFEYLYDHIEQTRVLKTTLDDQIRRSSSLMQTLQSSGTMMESLVRRQVRDMMDEKFESKLRECMERVNRLENRTSMPISPAISPSPTQEEKPVVVVKDLISQLMNRIDQLESKLVQVEK
jgi:hypothetical protein